MRVDVPTDPIAPAVTAQRPRWPEVNDLDEPDLATRHDDGCREPDFTADSQLEPEIPEQHRSGDGRVTKVGGPFDPLGRPWVGSSVGRAPARDEAPLPPIGDFWGVGDRSPQQRPPAVSGMVEPPRIAPPYPTPPPPAIARTTSPAASVALATGLLSVVTIPVAGLGAILGLIAVVSGAVGIRQISRGPGRNRPYAGRGTTDPRQYRGTGRAITGIITGTAGVLIGGPILVLVLMLVVAL